MAKITSVTSKKPTTALYREEANMTGEEIKQKRAEKGMTQEQLAQGLGVSVATVQRWEGNRHKPSPMAAKNLQRILR